MNTRLTLVLRLPILAMGLLTAAGCSLLPEPKPDPTRYFVLTSPAGAGEAAAESATVALRPVEVASYLRNRPIVVRRGENEISFRDLARWGEPLEQGIERVLREALLNRGVGGVMVSPVRSDTRGAEHGVNVRVLACEGAADGSVLFRAAWEISRVGATSETVGTGEFRATGLRWDGKSETSLVGQLSAAIGGLAAEIAAGVPKKR